MQGLLVKYGEIALRGKNRHLFENKLIDAIWSNINNEGKIYKVQKEQGRIIITKSDSSNMDYDQLVTRVCNTIGVTYVCPCVILEDQSIETLQTAVVSYLNEHHHGNYTFKIATKRAVKSYPLTSIEVSTEVGGYVWENIEGAEVDVVKPEVTVNVELRTKAYVFSKIIKGVGGLPQGGGGKALALLSGGIDSPVAAFLMARRGIEVEGVYFHSSPYTSEHAKQKVVDLAKRVGMYTGGMTLHIVNFTPTQLYLNAEVPEDKITIFLKRAMVKIAGMLGQKLKMQALVMGDSVGQVASQTLHSIAAIDAVNPGLPVLRPLATYDKQDIIDIATKIETYDISILPYEDCCTIFVPKHPTTKPSIDRIEKIEYNIKEKLDKLMNEALEDIETVKV